MKPDLHQGRTVDQLRRLYKANIWLFDALYMLAVCLAGAVLILAFGGCSLPADYWKKTGEPYVIVSIQHIPDPSVMCDGRPSDGCTVRYEATKTARIYIKAGLPKWLDECTERHEGKHAAGYSHADGVQSDCAY